LAPPVAGAALGQSPLGPPPLAGEPGTPAAVSTVLPQADEPQSGRPKWLLPAIVVVLLGLGTGAWFAFGRSDDEPKTVAITTPELPTTISVIATTLPTTATTDAPATTTTEISTTTSAPATTTTTPSTTVPPSTVPASTVPARPPWPAPAIPDPPIFAGPGLAYAISDPLASGMPSDEPTPYLAFAQQVFDQMAADDWANALTHFYFQPEGGTPGPFAFEQQPQWQQADRLSLLLVDAAPAPNGLGYDLQVAVVANFPGSTSLLCGRLHSDPTNYAEVIQFGPMVLLADGEAPFMPETLLNDPARVADLKARCK
jgi:hypothetical protein